MIKKSTFSLMPIFLALLSLFPQTILAEDEPLRFYNFELIIFKHKELNYFGSEVWDQEWDNIDISNSIDFQHPSIQPSRLPEFSDENQAKMAKLFKPLNNSKKTLTDTVKSIEESSRYELLAYYSWQQPGLDDSTAIPVRVRSQTNFNELKPINTPIVINDEFESATNKSNDQYELDGSVKIILTRFLHIHLDLRLLLPVTLDDIEQNEETETIRQQIKLSTAENPEAGLFGVNFREHRRMRSNELHHIDHPLLGVIVLATPATSSKP